MNCRVSNFKKLRLLTNYNFTKNLSVMPAFEEYYYKDEYEYDYNKNKNYYLNLSHNYLYKNNEEVIMQSTGNICNECKGSGWKTDNKYFYSNSLKTNFSFILCKKCKGTGLI
jgi:DnaJ-class molecular chaperone